MKIKVRSEHEFENAIKSIPMCNGELVIILKRNIDLSIMDQNLFPINAEGIDVSIYGNGYSLLNLNINSEDNNIGLFSKAKSLNVKDLDVDGFSIKGDCTVGALAGTIKENFMARKLNIKSEVTSADYVGGVVGVVGGHTNVSDSKINTSVHGYCVVGGIVGASGTKNIQNTTIKADLDVYSKRSGLVKKAFEDKEVGYLCAKVDRELIAMLKEQEEQEYQRLRSLPLDHYL